MKLNKLVMLALVSLFTFASCQDEKKDKVNENEMDTEVEMNENEMDANETSMEAEKEAEKTEMNLAQITMNSNKHTTLVSAVQGAGMVAKLESEGPFTIFAPTNEAFNKLPKGTVESLMKPESKEKLEGVLSYHIIPGEVDSKKLVDLINSNENKKYTIVTANDGKIDATIEDGKVMLTDAKGNKATVTDVDLKGSNGYVHSIDAVLMRE